LQLIRNESPEIGAVVLSKLDIAKAADLLSALPGPDARRLTIAVSETSGIAPDAVKRIGVALAAELKAEPPRAFAAAAVARLGAILDVAPAPTREEVLAGLSEEDEALAAEVRLAIFTFADIPARLEARDVPSVAKGVEQERLVLALAGATAAPALAAVAEFMLSNLPGRLADSIREEVAELGEPDASEAERAQIDVVRAIRRLSDAGGIKLSDRPSTS
jgi:flagellar motor switch protein FliG